MAKREKISARKNNYFTDEKTNLQFVSTGCTVLDCALGGGPVLGRVINVVGDKSTSKTGLATECLINFTQQYPKGRPAFREIEGAWDPAYAEAMGMPLDKIDFGDPKSPMLTVEDFARDLDAFVDAQIKANNPGFYALDSLDSLSDEAEMEKDIGEGTYGMAKSKQLSIMFRKITRKIECSKVTLMIISQVRDNINAMAFGEKQRRSGGKALDFYASQIVWLAHVKTLKKTIKGIERPYGIRVRAKVKKNKVGMPFREAEFDFIFGYGIDDLGSSISWLKEIGKLEDVIGNMKETAYREHINNCDDAKYREEQRRVAEIVKKRWREVEDTFLPKRQKYE